MVTVVVAIVMVVLVLNVVGKVVFRRQLRYNRENEEIRREALEQARENRKRRGKK
jgi:type II secretory pathway pseudopilin PulG